MRLMDDEETCSKKNILPLIITYKISKKNEK